MVRRRAKGEGESERLVSDSGPVVVMTAKTYRVREHGGDWTTRRPGRAVACRAAQVPRASTRLCETNDRSYSHASLYSYTWHVHASLYETIHTY